VSVEAVIRAYFAGEKFEAAWILFAGALALALAAWLWFGIREPFARGSRRRCCSRRRSA
jgi:peptidoglycan/LPS O-acetylase OafA/YrhL